MAEWRKLPLSLAELCIDTTLRCGQSFRWRRINNEWHCVLVGRIISLKQDPTHLYYRETWPCTNTPAPSPKPKCASPAVTRGDTESLLRSYFALSQSLTAMYEQWISSDANFARRAPAFTGIRILNQDAWETLVSFICSSNNNISRICQMVQKLCVHYGPYVGTIEGEAFHDFPGPEALTGSRVEAHLRELGFGYRAKYIADTARIVALERPVGWLLGLRNPDVSALGLPSATGTMAKKEEDIDGAAQQPTYKEAHEALLELKGVGPKVADCVCLMGLGWYESVPVDTHVWQIAQRDYNFGKGGKTKTFTKTMYNAVGDHFRRIWGPHAGWAQSVLFTANLKSFAEQASAKKEEAQTTMVKVEKTEATMELLSTPATSNVRSRKRKAVAVEVATKLEEAGETKEVKISATRTSKRLRTAR